MRIGFRLAHRIGAGLGSSRAWRAGRAGGDVDVTRRGHVDYAWYAAGDFELPKEITGDEISRRGARGGERSMAGHQAGRADLHVVVARGRDDDRPQVGSPLHSLDVLAPDDGLTWITQIKVPAERDADDVDVVIGRVRERVQNGRVVRRAAPLRDLQRHQFDFWRGAIDALAVQRASN